MVVLATQGVLEGSVITIRSAFTWATRAIALLVVAAALVWIFRPGHRDAAAVEFRDPTTWLTSGPTGELVQVNGATGDVSARVPVGDRGAALSSAVVDGGAVAIDHDANTVVLVDGVGLAVADTISLDDAAAVVSGVEHGFLVQGAQVSKIAIGTGMTSTVAVDEVLGTGAIDRTGSFWSVGAASGDLYRVSGDSFGRYEGVGRRDAGLQVVVVDGRPYLLNRTDAQLRPVRSGGGLGDATCLLSGLEASAPVGMSDPTSDSARVVVADEARARLQVAYLDEGRCASVDLARGDADEGFVDLGEPVVVGDLAYVPDYSAREVIIADLVDRRVLRRIPLDQIGGFELFVRDGIVWLNEPAGPAAAVIDRSGFVRVINKYEVGASADGDVGLPGVGPVIDGTDVALGNDVSSGGSDGDAPGGDGAGSGLGSGDGADTGTDGADDAAGLRLVVAPNGAAPPPEQTPIDAGVPPLVDAPAVVDTTPPDTVPAGDVDTEQLLADFTFSAAIVRVGESVTFTDRSTGSPTSWTWTLGDGRTLTGPVVTASWNSEGQFPVTLIIDRGSETASTSFNIQVLPDDIPVPPRADFLYSAELIEVGESITFTDSSSGEPTSFDWDFGDGATDDGPVVTHRFDQPGVFTVTLRVENRDGPDTATHDIRVLDTVEIPRAVIEAPASALVNQSVLFRSASTGNPTKLRWVFGDGTVREGSQVRHPFTEPGVYVVELTAENSAGADMVEHSILIEAPTSPPVARFVPIDAVITVGQSVSFTSTSTNEPTKSTWSFGDGSTAEGSSVTHVFASAGRFPVTLTVANDAGRDTATGVIEVEPGGVAPTATFAVEPSPAVVGTPVRFVDRSSGGPTSWSWDFGDDVRSTAQSPSHSYASPGDYTVRLTVTNATGSSQTQRSVTVNPPAPVASFTLSNSSPGVGEKVEFTNTSSHEPTSWLWDFGDNKTSDKRSPSHEFKSAGIYTVTLTVSNGLSTSSAQQTVSVSPPAPVAQFTYSPSTPRAGQPVEFNDSSSNTPLTWFWDFGDGATSTAQNPSHTFDAGSYSVTLTVTTGANSDTIGRTVEVAELAAAPTAIIEAIPGTIVEQGTTVVLRSRSTNDPDTVRWTLWNGQTSSSQRISIRFPVAGTYRIALLASNEGGQDSTFVDIVVNPPPPTADFDAAANGLSVTFSDRSSGVVTGRFWDFGDGNTSTAANPTHVYGASGRYNVNLVVSNASGEDSRQERIDVSVPRPTADFSAQINFLGVQFFNTSAGQITNYRWRFGDGTESTAVSPTHRYAEAGKYDVVLEVSGPGGEDDRKIKITVTAPPPPTTDPPPPPTTDPPPPPTTDPPPPPTTDPPPPPPTDPPADVVDA